MTRTDYKTFVHESEMDSLLNRIQRDASTQQEDIANFQKIAVFLMCSLIVIVVIVIMVTCV